MPMQNSTRYHLSSGENLTPASTLQDVNHLRFTPKANVLKRITDYSQSLQICTMKSSGAFDVILN